MVGKDARKFLLDPDVELVLPGSFVGVPAVDPAAWIREHAHEVVGDAQRVRVVAIGKAAEASARALVDTIGDRITQGLAIAPRPSSAAIGTIEVLAGTYRLVSLITRESADELELAPGKEVICVVKATDVMVEVPS